MKVESSHKVRLSRLFSMACIAVLLVASFPHDLFALTSNDRRYLYTPFYDDETVCAPTNQATTGSVLSSAEQIGAFTGGTPIVPTAIILHWTAGEYDSPEDLVNTLRGRVDENYPNGRAVQLTVDKEGTVYQLSEFLETPPIQTMADASWNNVSIGIEIESAAFPEGAPVSNYEDDLLNNSVQYEKVLGVVRELMGKFNIANEQDLTEKKGVFGHNEVNEGSSDPGENYMAQIRADLDSNPPSPAARTLSGDCSCEAGDNFSGENNHQIAFNYFISKGLSPDQSAGIVGNLHHESNVDPNKVQGGGSFSSPEEITPGTGYGIAQWTSADRQSNWLAYAEEQGRDPLSLELQLMFLFHELETNPRLGLQEIRASTDLRQATWIFLVFFERPSATSGYEENPEQATSGPAKAALDQREGFALEVLNNGAGGGGSRCIYGGINTSLPDFKAIPSIVVDGSPPGRHQPSNCTGNFTVGAESLRQFVLSEWSPPVTSIGGYSCRAIVGGSATSIHGLGRAIDIMVDSFTPEGLETGDNIRNHLINNAERYGVQRVIWNRKTWVANRDGWRDYNGANAHTDHLHVEINIEASGNANLAP